jgi:UDP-2,4-diacetamido-2,4,6-trideoxy-beta-L-altropyranose hydrolase
VISVVLADRDPEGRDSRLIWSWRNDSDTRAMSRNHDEIPWERHAAWYSSTSATLLLALVEREPAAMLRFDADEISINLNPAMRGRGLGERILRAGCTYGFESLGLARITAAVKSENEASNKIFTRSGFVLESEHDGLRSYLLKRG